MICKNDKKIFILYSGLALLFIYPLIQVGLFYRDDLDRAITGQYGWRGLGRPVADILMKILSASGHYNLDLFPYTMIASCLFIGAAALLLKNHLTKMEVPHSIFVAALLIFNPYMLQNLAYRYDSLAMSLAFFLAVLSYTYSNKDLIIEASVKIISGVLTLTLYQSCANIFIGLLAVDIIILGLKKDQSFNQSINYIFKRTTIFVLFHLVYMLFFGLDHNYRSNLITPNAEGIEQFLNTIKNLYHLIFSYFSGPVYVYFLLPLLTTFVLVIINKVRTNTPILPFLAYSTVSLVIFFFSLMGPTLLLQDAPAFPRTLVSFSVIFVILALPIVYFSPRIKYIALIPLITTLAFSAQLSSAMKSQREHEDFIFSIIAAEMMNHQEIKTIITTGQVNLSERVKLLIDNKPLINHFLSPATQFIASFQLINKGLIQTTHGYGQEHSNAQKLKSIISEGVKPIIANAEYAIYLKDNLAIVKLGSTPE